MTTKVTHLTSAHPRDDIRIFLKMCTSLAKKKEFDVSLIVADGRGDETVNSVRIIDSGARTGGRISRMTKTVRNVFRAAKVLNSDIYHLHDPELIPVGLKLKKLGKKVIFDAHEDVPKQLLGKPYLNKLTKIVLSQGFKSYEKYSCKKFDYIITATPFIRDKFLKINDNTTDINNFPILGELAIETPWESKKDEICYVGGITKIRGIEQVIEAMKLVTHIKLNLVGNFSELSLENKMKASSGWQCINDYGHLSREDVAKVMSSSKAGIVTFLPAPNHIEAQPNKMFEYMSAGLPIITSNFPLWKEIVEGNNCGFCVNPLAPKEIAKAINYLVSHPKKAEEMGKNGQKAVLDKFNWRKEEEKLMSVYDYICTQQKPLSLGISSNPSTK